MMPRRTWLDLLLSIPRRPVLAAIWQAAPAGQRGHRHAVGTALTLLCALLIGAAQAQAGAPATAPAPARPAASVACVDAITTVALLACVEEDFLAAMAEQAAPLSRLLAQLPAARRPAFRRAQTAWIGYRTSSCLFEASAAAGGSLAPLLQWRCAARLTRDRAALLSALLACPEGDVACPRSAPAAPARP